MTYVKWTDEYREKMEGVYRSLAVKTGLYCIKGSGYDDGTNQVISTRNVPNSVLKNRIREMKEKEE